MVERRQVDFTLKVFILLADKVHANDHHIITYCLSSAAVCHSPYMVFLVHKHAGNQGWPPTLQKRELNLKEVK